MADGISLLHFEQYYEHTGPNEERGRKEESEKRPSNFKYFDFKYSPYNIVRESNTYLNAVTRIVYLPNLATNCTTMLSPATAQRTSKAKSSYKTSQFSLDCRQNKTK